MSIFLWAYFIIAFFSFGIYVGYSEERLKGKIKVKGIKKYWRFTVVLIIYAVYGLAWPLAVAVAIGRKMADGQNKED